MSRQRFSALADSALLIVTIALLEQRGAAGWWPPLLKVAFTLAYVLLAPALGPLADALRKGRLMAWMNALKIAGAAALLGGVHPVLAFAVVGVGAAAYAPAKYGLVTELIEAPRLVAANGWLEVSVVCAVLLGTALGAGPAMCWAYRWNMPPTCRQRWPWVSSLGPLRPGDGCRWRAPSACCGRESPWGR